eukprot:scaffold950_cov360-Pavlova_lutheri.AAC.27
MKQGRDIGWKGDPPPGPGRSIPTRSFPSDIVPFDAASTQVWRRNMAGFDLQSFLKNVPSTESRSMAVCEATKTTVEEF